MELLKEVAKDRLVIMVTHNPELAEKYSTRIVNLKDGVILGDTNPYEPETEYNAKPVHKNLGKSSMSILTAFSLSLNNLLTKKGRTFLTSFAGSIGIIGIALILALSSGFQNYVDKIQEDTLTSYPLTIQEETADMTSILLSARNEDDNTETQERTVEEQQNMRELFGSVGRNDLKSFKQYLEENQDKVNEMVSFTKYDYSVTPTIYTKNSENEIVLLNPSSIMSSIMGDTSSSSMMGVSMSIFSELSENTEIVNDQYEVIDGRLPENYDEVVLVLPSENTISDLLLYSLGLRDTSELEELMTKIMAGEKVESTESPLEFTYDELKNVELKLIDASETYRYNKKYDIYEDMTEDEDFMSDVYDDGIKLNIVGIVKPADGMSSMTGVLYTRDLTEYVINKASESELVKKQLKNKDKNVFSGKDFDDDEKNAGIDFQDMITIDEDAISSAFNVDINQADIEKMTEGYMEEISDAITADTSTAQKTFLNNLSTITKNILNDYIDENEVAGFATIKSDEVEKVVTDGLKKDKNKKLLKEMEDKYVVPQETFSEMYSGIITGFLQQYVTMMSGVSNSLPTIPDTGERMENSITNQQIDNTTIDQPIDTPLNQSKNENSAILVSDSVDTIVDTLVGQDEIVSSTDQIAIAMTEATMQKTILTKVGELTGKLMESMASSFNIDTDKFAEAFKFEMNEDEIRRLMETMSTTTSTQNADTNLISLGYQDLDEPSSISFYFKDFASKELFLDFLDQYNEKMEQEDEDKVIEYTDLTGLLMSSVKTIVDSVSYVLIAFVSISLIVSSIMIGIITYISVLERTKEIGILRAIGASKRNISSIFNAETFIVGLFAGLIGIGVTLLLLIPINLVIHSINTDITAVLPFNGGAILVILSVVLTLIGGLIPSRKAAKRDPVLALRSE